MFPNWICSATIDFELMTRNKSQRESCHSECRFTYFCNHNQRVLLLTYHRTWHTYACSRKRYWTHRSSKVQFVTPAMNPTCSCFFFVCIPLPRTLLSLIQTSLWYLPCHGLCFLGHVDSLEVWRSSRRLWDVWPFLKRCYPWLHPRLGDSNHQNRLISPSHPGIWLMSLMNESREGFWQENYPGFFQDFLCFLWRYAIWYS